MLEAKNMNITYDCVRALRGVSISLNRGEILLIKRVVFSFKHPLHSLLKALPSNFSTSSGVRSQA